VKFEVSTMLLFCC